MSSGDNDKGGFVEAVEAAIKYGGPMHGVDKIELFNAAAEHVNVLLADAVDAFRRRSFGTSVFLAITAMEETAKAEILGFRTGYPEDGLRRRRDPLRDHASKHRLAVRPTTFMGRLPALLGEDRCHRLRLEAETGELVRLCERALYVNVDTHGVTTPAVAIREGRAREVLLLALEVADDVLVGWTNQSYSLGEHFEAWLNEFGRDFGPE